MSEPTPQELIMTWEARIRDFAFRNSRPSMQPLGNFEHRDGKPWYELPAPSRWHRCRWQTWGVLAFSLAQVHRCACGAIRRDGGPWESRNSRRRDGTLGR